jgi:hypothetical protein
MKYMRHAKGKQTMPRFGTDGSENIGNKKPEHPPVGCKGQGHVRSKEVERAGSGK